MPAKFRWAAVLAMGVFLPGFSPTALLGQAANSASLIGKVTDSGGAPLPGVLIEVTGPQLQVPKLTSTSDEVGNYQVLNLPAPGVYQISVSLQGFERFVRSNINLGVGFAGRVDIPMKIGAITETVEVTAGSPVIDTTSAGTTSTLDQTALQEIPKGMTMQEMLPMVKGVSLQGTPDVGDSNLAARVPIITYGVVLVPTLNYENINMATDKASDTAVYLDSFAIAEAEFKAVGNNADVAFPGVDQEAVMKSGSNTFHGHVRGDYENPNFQGTNTPSTASSAPLTNFGYYDYSGDFGGRIIRDKLWFYGGYSYQGVDQGEPNLVAVPGTPGVGGCNYLNYWLLTSCPTAKQGDVVTSLTEWDYKLSYQMKPRVKLLFTSARGTKLLSDNGFNATTPVVAGQYELSYTELWHADAQIPVTPKFFLDAGFGHVGYHTVYTTMTSAQIGKYGYTKGSDFAGSPSEQEQNTKAYTGPYFFPQNRPQYRYEAKVFASFVPTGPHLGGTHQLKIGTVEDWENAGTRVINDKPSGDYLLLFNTPCTPAAGATTCVQSGTTYSTTNPQGYPYRITLYNYPLPNSINHLTSISGFITDQMKIKRVTLSFGVRGETYNDGYPTQSKTAGQFSTLFPPVSYTGQQILQWTDFVPRVGGAWDVRGDGKTVVKGSFGMFGDTMGDLFSNTFNPNAQQSYTFPWSSALNTNPNLPAGNSFGNCQASTAGAPIQYSCDVSSAYLAYLNRDPSTFPANFIVAQTGGVSQVLNPGLKQDRTYEYAGSIERQIVPNVSVSASYVNHHIYNLYNAATNAGVAADSPTFRNTGINVGHPLSSYVVPVRYTDTFNGVSTTETAYTYCTAAIVLVDPVTCPVASGNNNNEVLNNPSSRPDSFNSIEVAVTKKYSKKWTGDASFWTTRNHRWIYGLAGIAGSPNDNFFPLDDTWNWEARADVAYTLPWGFQAFSFYRAQSGIAGQRFDQVSQGTDISGNIAGGATPTVALGQGTVTIFQEPIGSRRGPLVSLWNLKGAKTFKFKERYSVEANFQVFNVLNSNAGVTINYNSSPSLFGGVSDIVAPRVFRLGGIFSF